MSTSRTNFLISTRAGRLLLLFWLGCAVALTGRLVFEARVARSNTVLQRHGEHYDYLLILPRDYSVSDPQRPLLVFLHGSGEVSGNLDDFRAANPVAYGAGKVHREDFPFLVVCPKLND